MTSLSASPYELLIATKSTLAAILEHHNDDSRASAVHCIEAIQNGHNSQAANQAILACMGLMAALDSDYEVPFSGMYKNLRPIGFCNPCCELVAGFIDTAIEYEEKKYQSQIRNS